MLNNCLGYSKVAIAVKRAFPGQACVQAVGVAPARTSAKSNRSMFPPDRITPILPPDDAFVDFVVPDAAARDCNRAASGAAPAPSANVWQSS